MQLVPSGKSDADLLSANIPSKARLPAGALVLNVKIVLVLVASEPVYLTGMDANVAGIIIEGK